MAILTSETQDDITTEGPGDMISRIVALISEAHAGEHKHPPPLPQILLGSYDPDTIHINLVCIKQLEILNKGRNS